MPELVAFGRWLAAAVTSIAAAIGTLLDLARLLLRAALDAMPARTATAWR